MSINRQSVSKTKSWCTPPEYVEAVKKVFGGVIHLDPCANCESLPVVGAVVSYVLPTNGLSQPWCYPTIYLNPPYGYDKDRGTSIRHWLRKAADSHRFTKSEVIALIPVATNTKHWQENIFLTATAVCFLKVPRLKFWMGGKADNKGAPMACAVVYWGTDYDKFDEVFSDFGKVVRL